MKEKWKDITNLTNYYIGITITVDIARRAAELPAGTVAGTAPRVTEPVEVQDSVLSEPELARLIALM